MNTAALARAGLVVSWISVGACITVPPPLQERLAASSDGGGGAGQGGAGGGAPPGSDAPPPCEAGESADCSPAVALTAGSRHTCALVADGHVWCWGSNLFGELGDPQLPPLSHYPPQLVPGLENVDAIEANDHSTCARVDGDAYCWGRNDRGQLGLGHKSSVLGIRRVTLPVNARVTLLAGSSGTMCAIVDREEVWCWGRLLNGQEWWGRQSESVPRAVAGFSDMPRLGHLAVGTHVACAADVDGLDVRCWGGNSISSSVGDGNLGNAPGATPIPAPLVTPITSLSSSGFVCATAQDQVQCWGDLRAYGMDIHTEPAVLTNVDGNAHTQQLGWRHQCFLRANEEVDCRGYGPNGELGLMSTTGFTHEPVPVIGDVVHLAVGYQHNCAILSNGGVQCWGNNRQGQCTKSTDELLLEPQAVVFDP